MKLNSYLALFTTLLLGSLAQALTVEPYSAQTLAKLQATDKPVALHFHADWCPTCRAQDKSLEALKTDATLPVTVLTVNYDKESELKKQLHIQTQSTFVVYHGAAEKARSIGETSPGAIAGALRAAL